MHSSKRELSRRIAAVGIVGAGMLAALGPSVGAAQSISPACPEGTPSAGFSDSSGVHGAAIDCIAWWEITVGTSDGRFGSTENVTRGQLATFLKRIITITGSELAPATDEFPDDAGSVHEAAIDELAAAGIVGGFPDGTFRPGAPVTRAQAASMIVKALEHRTDAELPAGSNAFTDDDGSVHEPAINALSEAGIVTGLSPTEFGPERFLTRAQMASLLARSLALLVDEGLAALPADGVTITRLSVAVDGTEADGQSYGASVSGDGRFVAFVSDAENLIEGPSNTNQAGLDVFVRDVVSGTTELVHVASDGTPGNKNAIDVSISLDGRTVAFSSFADNLVTNDTNGVYADVFVHDRQTRTTEMVSVSSDGTQGQGDLHLSTNVVVSGNGRYVAFTSGSPNLVAGDTNGNPDVFVHDRITGQTELVSVASDGTLSNGWSFNQPSISADGRYVEFFSQATNLIPGQTGSEEGGSFLRDRDTGQTALLPHQSSTITDDARYIVYFDGSRTTSGGLIEERESGSVDSLPSNFTPFSTSADGHRVAGNRFNDEVFIYDRRTSTLSSVSRGMDGSEPDHFTYVGPGRSISSDGSMVVFTSKASNLVAGDNNQLLDVFLARIE